MQGDHGLTTLPLTAWADERRPAMLDHREAHGDGLIRSTVHGLLRRVELVEQPRGSLCVFGHAGLGLKSDEDRSNRLGPDHWEFVKGCPLLLV